MISARAHSVGDSTFEPTETFVVTLNSAVNATVPPSTSATGTLVNDD